jgi:DNA-binding transcriptional LysR family regulator
MKVLRKNIKQLNTEIHGNFILSMHSLFAQNVVSKIEKELLGFDSITVDYRFEQSSEAIHGVLNGSTDMAIVTKVQEAEGLMKIELKDEYIGLYSNTGQKEAQLIYNENMVYANQCLTQYGQFKRQIGNYQVLKSVLQQGGFMGLLPSSIAETDRSLKLIEKSLTGIKVYLVYREDRSLTAGFSKIIETIKQIFSNGRLQ